MATKPAELSKQLEETKKRVELVAEGLMRVAEAAKLLSLSKSTIYDLMDSGTLASVRMGGARRLPRKAVVEYAAANLEGVN